MNDQPIPLPRPVVGREYQLPNGRLVFVGKREGSDQTLLRFRNEEGNVTKLSLTPEAAVALHLLLGPGERGLPKTYPEPYEVVSMWQPVDSARP